MVQGAFHCIYSLWRVLLALSILSACKAAVVKHGSSVMQVLGEMHSAMQSIADFSGIVWDEVNQTCKEESDHIGRSFHLRSHAR